MTRLTDEAILGSGATWIKENGWMHEQINGLEIEWLPSHLIQQADCHHDPVLSTGPRVGLLGVQLLPQGGESPSQDPRGDKALPLQEPLSPHRMALKGERVIFFILVTISLRFRSSVTFLTSLGANLPPKRSSETGPWWHSKCLDDILEPLEIKKLSCIWWVKEEMILRYTWDIENMCQRSAKAMSWCRDICLAPDIS
jgi:hypothetical protein